MCELEANGNVSSAASMGVPVNFMQLSWRGCYASTITEKSSSGASIGIRADSL
jgi:hypothetical protein